MELATFDRFILFTKALKLLVVKSKATTLQCDGCFLYFRTNLGMHRQLTNQQVVPRVQRIHPRTRVGS